MGRFTLTRTMGSVRIALRGSGGTCHRWSKRALLFSESQRWISGPPSSSITSKRMCSTCAG